MRGIFVQSNTKQLIGAKIAKYALETTGKAAARGIPVTIIEVEQQQTFRAFVGKPYRSGYAPYTFDDLQSFTLTRFMPPELMNYTGQAIVIDPDIFALSDISPLFDTLVGGAAIAACRKKDAWDTSVMALDCAQLQHWRVPEMLRDIAGGRRSYDSIMTLKDESAPIVELGRKWNSLDTLSDATRMLHTTNRLTQPWKTGLPIDFTFNPIPKLFGVIPRFWVQHPTHYQEHPDPEAVRAFFAAARAAHAAGAVSKSEIDAAIAARDLRSDFWQALDQ
ncbi:MAG: hypothetical protein AAB955_00410 [Patescibacteria group bacterium]